MKKKIYIMQCSYYRCSQPTFLLPLKFLLSGLLPATLLSFPTVIPVFLDVPSNSFPPSNLHSLLRNTKALQFT